MGLILIYSRANVTEVKLLLCLACGYKIQVYISLWTLISKDLLVLFFFPVHFFHPQTNPMACHFLLNTENDLAYFDGIWTIVLPVSLILYPRAVSHYGYERQNIESLAVRHLCGEGWSLSRAPLLVIITFLYLHCSRTLIPSRSQGSVDEVQCKHTSVTVVLALTSNYGTNPGLSASRDTFFQGSLQIPIS